VTRPRGYLGRADCFFLPSGHTILPGLTEADHRRLGVAVSKETVAFWAVLIGAGIAAIASVIATLLTAKLAERRERRARLFDTRRTTYAEALHAASVAKYALTEPVIGDPGMDTQRVGQFMAELELLGSPEVYRAYGELMAPLGEAMARVMQGRASLPKKPTQADFEAAFGSEEIRQLVAAIGPAEVKLHDLMRKDLGEKGMGEVYLW
jgi:hypothetical protein